MKTLKESKGITLVALIITIIVLLILAAVAISAISGDGIIIHAKNAADKYEQAQLNELETVLEYGEYIDEKLGYKVELEETDKTYFTYTVSGGSATITGFTETGLAAYNNGELATLVLPKTDSSGNNVVAIGASAFSSRTGIEKLVIHDGITTLNSYAFNGCTGLKELTIPISVDAYYKFNGCTGLEKITFTKGTGTGYTYTSGNYNDLPWYLSRTNEIDVEFEEGITSIGNYMFMNCIGMKIISLPGTLTTIGTGSFAGCTGMVGELRLSQSLTSIGASAFTGCTGLTGKIEIPLGITAINDYVFDNCTGIEKLVLHDGITTLGSYSFRNTTGLKELTIPISVDAYYKFNGCTGLEKITFTKGTGTGYSYTAGAYDDLPWYLSRANEIDVEFEEGITSIGNYMICDCTGVKTVILPSTLTSIGDYAFFGITSPTYYFRGTEAQWTSVTIGTNNSSLTTPTYNYSE